jgi:hypothetical protein
MVGYYVVGYLVAATVDAALVASMALQEGSAGLPGAVQEGWQLWLARFAYLPVFGVLLSPAPLAWILAIRTLRDRLGT